MASLTPGVLLKLLQSMNSDAKVAGDHRSAVLQVVGIVPALSASTADDLWPSHGFYLQLSDSAHSTYVSLSDDDAAAVLSSRPQLGQLVHVDGLRFNHPVPRAVGLRPVPGARPRPFVGSPNPLVALSSPDHRGFVIRNASPSEAGPPLTPFSSSDSSLRSDSHFEEPKRTVFAVKENVFASGKSADVARKPQQFSSPSSAKLAASKSGGGNGARERRAQSPAIKTSSRPSSPALAKASPRPSSPVPSKSEVPSLVAAREEKRRVAKEPAIIVPSRYRQPSPVGRKASPSPIRRRGSMSPARRLSGGLKLVSPIASEVGGKKKAGVVVAGISRVSDALMGSSKLGRKSWDDANTIGISETKGKTLSKSKVDKEAILRTQVAISRRLSDAGVLKNCEASVDGKTRPSTNFDFFSEIERRNMGPKVTIQNKKWTDGSIPLNAVSDTLARLGKEALIRRNVASIAAAEALEEALVTESVIRSISMFSDLCSSSKVEKDAATIDRFLSIYDDVLKYNTIVESLFASRTGDGSKDAIATERSRLTSLWVEAALATDLEVLHLLDDRSECLLKTKFSEGVLPFDPPRTSVSKRQSSGTPAQGHFMISNCTAGYGVCETLELAKSLRREMQLWFLKFAEDAMDVGFHTFVENSNDNRHKMYKGNGNVAAVILSQLKKINDWMDGLGRTPEAETLKEKIEGLKRKIYGVVLSHVGNAFDTSVPFSKA